MRNRHTELDTARRAPRGFSITEILVVVGIIAILVAAVAFVGVGMREAGKRQMTRARIEALMGVHDEYQAITGNRVNSHKVDTRPFDWSTEKARNGPEAVGTNLDTPEDPEKLDGTLRDHGIERFVWATWQVPDTRDLLQAIGKEALVDAENLGPNAGNGYVEVRDAWGNKLVYASYAWDPASDDNTPNDDFLPPHGTSDRWRPFFASAGKDGLWGGPGPDGDFGTTDDLDANGDGTPDHEDNLYSYEVQ